MNKTLSNCIRVLHNYSVLAPLISYLDPRVVLLLPDMYSSIPDSLLGITPSHSLKMPKASSRLLFSIPYTPSTASCPTNFTNFPKLVHRLAIVPFRDKQMKNSRSITSESRIKTGHLCHRSKSLLRLSFPLPPQWFERGSTTGHLGPRQYAQKGAAYITEWLRWGCLWCALDEALRAFFGWVTRYHL